LGWRRWALDNRDAGRKDDGRRAHQRKMRAMR